MTLIAVALAPVIVLLFYIYKRDKYEKEPKKLLLKSFLFGIISVIPIIFIEYALSDYWEAKYAFEKKTIQTAFYDSFIVAAFTEEFFKILVFFIFIWNNKNFNEKFDGIVYAVYISMGFATAENILYVMQNGLGTGILRAFTAVPAHAVFAVTSGYFLARAKFKPSGKNSSLLLALLVPILLHGLYDFFILSQIPFLLLLFVPYIIFLFIIALKSMKKLSDSSRFKH